MRGSSHLRSRRRVGVVPIVIIAALLGLVSWVAVRAFGGGAGTPRLAVDTTAIDLGQVPFDTYVDPAFTITNVGDAPLKVIGRPEVEIVQGC